MKTFTQIQKEKLPGDFEIIAEALGQTSRSVKSKVLGTRTDTDDLVRSAFSILLQDRKLSSELIKMKIRRQLNVVSK